MRHRPDTLMLFAAGLGRRMAPLTDDCPKPLLPVAGRALIDHALDVAAAAGIHRIVVNTHYRAAQMTAFLATRGVQIVNEDTLLDTGGGLRNALRLLGQGPVLTLNSDAVWAGPNPLEVLLDRWDEDRMQALLLLGQRDRSLGHGGRGDFGLDASGRLGRGGDLIYLGAQIVQTPKVAAWPEAVFSMNRIWDDMIAEAGLFGIVHPGLWCDVGTPAGIEIAERMLAGP